MSTDHVSIEDSEHRLPDSGGSVIFQQTFDAPGVDAVNRPFLSYRVTPVDAPVQLQIDLNTTRIVDETFNSGVSRSLNEIFDTGILQAQGNDLIVSRAGNSGSFDFSDLIMVYSRS